MHPSASVCSVLGISVLLQGVLAGCGEEPTFYTAQGTAIWTHDQDEVTEESISSALELFTESVSVNFGENDVRSMLRRASVEFTTNPIEYAGEQYAGLQHGLFAQVYWLGGVGTNSLYHELMHMLLEMVLHREADLDHSEKKWWDMVRLAKTGYSAANSIE